MPIPPTERRNFIQDFYFAQWFTQFPALTIQVILRRDVGYRVLNPLKLIAVMGGLAVIAILATPGNEDARPTDLLVFAGISFLFGLAQRIRRWLDVDKAARQHSYYVGSSPFDFRWLPNFIRRNRRVARYFDPLACALIGVTLLPYTRALAMWLIFSGFCLRALEHQIFAKERNRDLDLSDSVIMAEQQARNLDRMDQSQSKTQHQADGGIPTGLGDDIHDHVVISIKRRRKQTEKPPIDI
jgi:hypothetical protein